METAELLAWKPLGTNEVLEGKGFYISYNPNTSDVCSSFTNFGNALGGNFKDGEETALCYDGSFYILEGDFRKEYASAFPKGLNECKKVFEKHKVTNRSNWSD